MRISKEKASINYLISPWLQMRRSMLIGTFRQIFRILCNIEINGTKNIPLGTAYIIAYNHISLFEPPLLVDFWPEIDEDVAGADVFDRPFQKFLVRSYKAIPVHRGAYDRKVIDVMLDVLQSGKPLAISPEGGRTHETSLRKAQVGVAYLLDRSKVPVLPVGISGTTDDMLKRALIGKRPKLVMNIGEAFHAPAIKGKGATRRNARQDNADLVMRKIAKLIPENHRGYYG
jgi:1-acyl-sn-glycerol-3-phosphate acyltransferase